jgi:hypothetical protein
MNTDDLLYSMSILHVVRTSDTYRLLATIGRDLGRWVSLCFTELVKKDKPFLSVKR